MAGSVISVSNIPSVIRKGVLQLAQLNTELPPSFSDRVYHKKNEFSHQAYETIPVVAPFALPSRVAEGAKAPALTEQEFGKGVIYYAKYAAVFGLTKEALLYCDPKFRGALIMDRLRRFMQSFKTRKEKLAAEMFITGFLTAFPYDGLTANADGQPLFSQQHPGAPGITNLSNVLSTSIGLSETGIEQMVIQMRRTRNAAGQFMFLEPYALITATDKSFDAQRIIKSTQTPSSANNAVNVVHSDNIIKEYISTPYLSDAPQAWYMTTNLNKEGEGLLYLEAEKYTVEDDIAKDETLTIKHVASELYAFGLSDWRGCFGSQGF